METAGETTLSPSITACLSMIFKSVKFTPPTSRPIAGIMMSPTTDDTIFTESTADNDTHSHVDHVAAHGELFELL